MNEIVAVSPYEGTEQTRAKITLMHELLAMETDPEKRADLQDEIHCIAESWFVGEMFSEDNL